MTRRLARAIPVVAFAGGALGVYLSSPVLIVLAILVAGYVIARGIATLSGENAAGRRLHDARRLWLAIGVHAGWNYAQSSASPSPERR